MISHATIVRFWGYWLGSHTQLAHTIESIGIGMVVNSFGLHSNCVLQFPEELVSYHIVSYNELGARIGPPLYTRTEISEPLQSGRVSWLIGQLWVWLGCIYQRRKYINSELWCLKPVISENHWPFLAVINNFWRVLINCVSLTQSVINH